MKAETSSSKSGRAAASIEVDVRRNRSDVGHDPRVGCRRGGWSSRGSRTSRDNPPTELEVTFTADGDGTRVDLEHRGWERLGALAEEARSGYGENWNGVLALFAAAAEHDRTEG